MRKLTLTMCLIIMTVWIVSGQRGVDKVSLTPIQLPNVLSMPGPLPDFLRQNYPDFVVDEAYKIAMRGSGIVTYEVKLTKGGDIKRTLLYDQNGTYYKYGIDNVSLTPIQLPRVLNMPTAMSDFLNKNNPGFVIHEAYQVVASNNSISYELAISKGATSETLVFDQNGQFLRKKVGEQIQRKGGVSRSRR